MIGQENAERGPAPAWPKSITIRLPSLPPGTNGLYPTVGNRRVLSAEARAWKEQAGWLTRQALTGVEPLTPPLTVSLFAYGLSRKRDLDGCLKIAIDAVCEAMGVDDRYVDEVYAVRVLSRDGPRLDVVVSELTREERA